MSACESNSSGSPKTVTTEIPKTTPSLPAKQLSGSLKERLKRCGRYHTSPTAHNISSDFIKSCLYKQETNTGTDGQSLKPVTGPSEDDSCAVKVIKLTEEQNVVPTQKADDLHKVGNKKMANVSTLVPEKSETHQGRTPKMMNQIDNPCEDVQKNTIKHKIEEKEEMLRKLKMVKMYHSKNDLSQLQTLIDKWREVSQQAIIDLHQKLQEPKPGLTELVVHLGIECKLVCYNPEEESFG